MFKIKIIKIFVLLLCAFQIRAQSTLITPGNNQPAINASSSNTGVLIPRISLSSNLSSATPVLTPAEGMLVYNIGALQAKGFYYWTGLQWILLANSNSNMTATAPLSIQSNDVKINPGTAAGQLISWDGTNWVNINPKPATVVSNMQPYLVLNYCIALAGIFPSRNSDLPFLGEIELYAFNFDPRNFAFCNGQILAVSQNQALFSLLGTQYGGNGTTTFALPDLRGRVAIHQGQGTGLTNRPIGQNGGVESNTINDKY